MAPCCVTALFVASICISRLVGASRLHDETEAVASDEDDRYRFIEGQIAELTSGVGLPESRHERMRDREWESIHQAKAEDADSQGQWNGTKMYHRDCGNMTPILCEIIEEIATKQHNGIMPYPDGNKLNDTVGYQGLVAARNPGLTTQGFRTFGLVLLRIQKTGTTTFEEIASEQYKRMGGRACDTYLHLDWNFVSYVATFDPKRVIVTILRNPVIRVISEGNFLRTAPSYAQQVQWDYTPSMYKMLLEWIRVNGTMAEFANLPFNPANNRQVRYILGFGRPAPLSCYEDCDELWSKFAKAGGVTPAIAIEDAVTSGGAHVLDVVQHRLEHEIDFFGVTECFKTSLKIANKILQWDPTVTKPFFDKKMRPSKSFYEGITTAAYQQIKGRNALDVGMMAGAIELLAQRAKALNIDFVCEDPHVKTKTEHPLQPPIP
eukprot:TRINITY_DN10078_c0_g3_i1.p1 TRINITY_DN10078_c0_g3~~TRINITY_DN10078_c0_g3_i1.p1  ORF type:complete len:435 (-),score=46.99 TRINITY_DN10078_c0_g3_i1:96-1400(-)